ncbi:MAG TPA: cysteine desulfurase [Longimicrobiales bacterium]|nr:cysteine desulfurase [Longimicrobiales bacterium]
MSSQATSTLDVNALRRQFPILRERVNGRELVYLDSAATSQKPQSVIDSISGFYQHDNANVHRGLYELSRRSTERYESARETIARFLNARETREVVWVRGTTEAINLVSATWGWANVSAGDEIVLTMVEHHSNLVPWQLLAQRVGARLRFVDIDDEGRLSLDHLKQLLNPRTKLVGLNHISNALGTINPVAEVCRLAHAVGAKVLVDGAQAAPHVPIDVQALDCDFYAISGHKMCGPMGIGALWARAELLEQMPPYHGGGEMIDVVQLEYSTYAKIPHKFEAGTPDAAGAVGLAAAVDFLNGIGFDAIAAHEQELVRYGLERLAEVPGLRLFGPRDPEDRIAVFSFELDGMHPHDIATVLDAEGIAIRAGHHCAQPLMRRLGVPATTRASCYLYNLPSDLDRMIGGLETARALFSL